MKPAATLLLLAAILSLSACNEEKTANASPEIVKVEDMLGKWTGPEGTFLELTEGEDALNITIQNLDGPRTFPAMKKPDGTITFDRDGKTETLTKGDGAATGMKWLADKSDCIVVTIGEGYCRD